MTNKILYQTIKDNISKICDKCPTYIKFTGSFIIHNEYLLINNIQSYPDELYQVDNESVLCIKLKFVFT